MKKVDMTRYRPRAVLLLFLFPCFSEVVTPFLCWA